MITNKDIKKQQEFLKILETCKYCEHEKLIGGAMIVEDYNKKEAIIYAEHLQHKHNL